MGSSARIEALWEQAVRFQGTTKRKKPPKLGTEGAGVEG